MDNIKNDSTVSEAAIVNRVGLSESGIQYHIKKMKGNCSAAMSFTLAQACGRTRGCSINLS